MAVTAVLALMAIASAAGLLMSRNWSWTQSAYNCRLPAAVGFSMGPFILGISHFLSMTLLSGYSFLDQGLLTTVFCIAVGVVAVVTRNGSSASFPSTTVAFGVRSLSLIVFLLFATLLLESLRTPWYANDALEYATVARELAVSRNISMYPLIHPAETQSGFFSPMTHPPLYPVLLVLFEGLAGSAIAGWPGKLVSLWFAASVVVLTYSVGAMNRQIAGLIAVALLITTPLFLDSVGSGLIDALPMAGLMLLVSAHIGVAGSGWRRGIVLGMVLGFSLWTHSQAILFVPISIALTILQSGWANRRSRLQELSSSLAIAAVFAVAPYGKNILLFGSPVSDNPEIFALTALQWNEYFSVTRGLQQAAARIQYGLFKGWFAKEAFGAVFWISTPGLLLAIFRFWRTSIHWGFRSSTPPSDKAETLIVAVIMLYYVGVAISLAAGNDVIVRNDRYLLAWLPPVTIVGGIGLALMLETSVRWIVGEHLTASMRELFAVASFAMLVIFVVAPAANVLSLKLPSALHSWAKSDFRDRSLKALPNIDMARSIATDVSPDALILAQRPADMYYSNRRMVSYLDPRMKQVYQDKDSASVAATLHSIGVTHVQIPDYYLPTVYRTSLGSLINDPSESTLVADRSFNQLYALADSKQEFALKNELGKEYSWRSRTTVNWIGIRRLGLNVETQLYRFGESSRAHTWGGLFQRSFTTDVFMDPTERIAVSPRKEYRFDAVVTGHGYITIWADFGNGTVRMTDIVAATDSKAVNVSRRFRVPEDSDSMRIGFSHVGNSSLAIQDATLSLAIASPNKDITGWQR